MRRLALSTLLLSICLSGTAWPAQVQRGKSLPRAGFLGVQTAAVEGGKGVRVVRIVPGGSGEALGLKADDVLLSLNGTVLATQQQLNIAIRAVRGGDALKIAYVRAGKEAAAGGKMIARPIPSEPGLDVIFDQVLSRGNRVRVMITKPKGPGRFPTLFFIGGIGAYSMDGALSSSFYGKVLGPVSQAGYVTVRIDKPGIGDSEGPEYKNLGFGEEKDAYLQALRLTKTLEYVDPDRIAIFGHSMGGCFGPLVAAEEPVKALLVTGTLYKTFGEYMLENTRRQAELGGAAPDGLDQTLRQCLTAMHYLFDEGLTPKQASEEHPETASWIKGNFPDGETYSGVGFGFWRELANTNLAKAWSGTNADVLAIYSENDFLSGRDDHERIAAAMNRKRAGSGEFRLLEGTDHIWSKTTSMRDSQEKWGKASEFNPSIVETVLDYLKRKLRGEGREDPE
ncbi:MAG: alpha/beta fold hydrolase [Fimbriimonadaceae bacterium]|nr:alpha/beta fold hydrolase [Chthonomonadaceae bacterium]MCO5296256.1 alpha/beta fold hydrolase [Fimbriimonadaceae bacterium]